MNINGGGTQTSKTFHKQANSMIISKTHDSQVIDFIAQNLKFLQLLDKR